MKIPAVHSYKKTCPRIRTSEEPLWVGERPRILELEERRGETVWCLGGCLKALEQRGPGGVDRADASHLSLQAVPKFHLLHFHILAKSKFGFAF